MSELTDRVSGDANVFRMRVTTGDFNPFAPAMLVAPKRPLTEADRERFRRNFERLCCNRLHSPMVLDAGTTITYVGPVQPITTETTLAFDCMAADAGEAYTLTTELQCR